MDMSPVDIVVNVYNEEANLADFLESLLKQTYPNFKVILVDDGSTDRTVEIAKKYQDHLSVEIVCLPHLGLRGARAKGVERVTNDIFIIFDADEVIERSCVEHMVDAFKDPRVAAVGGRTVAREDSWTARGHTIVMLAADQALKHKDSITTERIRGGCSAYRTAVIKDLGGFVSEDQLIEDAEMSWRLQRAGWKVVARDDVIVYHNDPSGLGGMFMWGYKLGRLGFYTRLHYKEKFLKWHLLVKFGPLSLLVLALLRPALAAGGAVISFLLFLYYVRKIPGTWVDRFDAWVVFMIKSLGWSISFIIHLGIHLGILIQHNLNCVFRILIKKS
ncbi:MAG: glycosyltransferase [Candidatus Hodarchaeota archaeon]